MSILPGWSLDVLYSGINDQQINTDVSALQKSAQHFARLRGYVSKLSPNEFLDAIKEVETIYCTSSKIDSFASLNKSVNMLDSEISSFSQKIIEILTDINKDVSFFDLEINEIEDIESYYKTCPALIYYKEWLSQVRRFKKHQLPLESEQILQDKNLTGAGAWVKLFSELHAELRYDFRGELLSYSEIAIKMLDKDEKIRKDAGLAISTVLHKNSTVLTHIMNNITKDEAIDAKLRNLPRPVSGRNLANNIDDAVIDTMTETVRNNYPAIAHRYYRMKAKILGKDKLEYWDRNAPLPSYENERYTWDQAKTLVLGAYREFSPKMADLGCKFFDEHAIDVPVRPHKDGGAFCCPVAPDITPFLLVNFQGEANDVYTLAHEMGHGIHYLLASENTVLMYGAPLTFAETASIFGERLLFRSLLDSANSKKARVTIISDVVEGMINSIVRQTAFYDFETAAHNGRSDGELSKENINDIWLKTQSRSLGDGIKLDNDYACYWSAIPHFIHTPFYVYAYAFGACLVNSLYASYLKEGKSFIPRYERLLSMGGAVTAHSLKADFGFDLYDKGFWQTGLDVVINLIDELEMLLSE